MTDRRLFRWATTSARLLIGTVVAACAVVAVVTAVSVPWPTLVREPVQIIATPSPASTVVSCDGGLLILGRDLADPGRLQSAAPQSVTSGVGPDAPEPESERLRVADLDVEGPVMFTAAPDGDERTDVAASGSASAAAEDITGFAASACRPPLMESWLVAGSASTGASDLILLTNPGTVPATVQLTVFGAAGPQTPPGGADLVVPARSQRVVPIAGLALGEVSPVIRVTAVGAPVQAAIQATLTRVLVPGGVDQAGALAGTDETQTIAGVTVTEPPGTEGASDAATVVRLLSPSADAGATVTVRAVGGRDPAIPAVSVPLVAGLPTEVELGGLPVGEFIVDVVADSPIVAAVWQAAGFGEGSDFAWYTPSPAVTVPTLFAVPAGTEPTLTLVNPGDTAETVSLVHADGSESVDIDVPPGSSTTVEVTRRTVYYLDTGGADIRAAVSFTGEGALAGFPVWPADAAAPPMLIYP